MIITKQFINKINRNRVTLKLLYFLFAKKYIHINFNINMKNNINIYLNNNIKYIINTKIYINIKLSIYI